MHTIEGPRYGVPQEVEDTIQQQARGFARRAGMPDVAEDLAQEARVEAWQTAVVEGDEDIKHILADTRERIRDAARIGSSVDGKIYRTWKRPSIYGVISLEQPVGENGSVFGEILIDENQAVETQVLGSIMVDEAIDQLTVEEKRVLRAKLEGYTHKEMVKQDEVLSPYLVKKHTRRIREKVARYLEREDLL